MISAKSFCVCALVGLLSLSAPAATISLNSADSGGVTAAITADANAPAAKTQLFIGAVYGGRVFLRGSQTQDWRLYQGGRLPVAASNQSFAVNSTLPLIDFDPALLIGLDLYVGYGAEEAELFLPGHLYKVYSVPDTAVVGACGSANGAITTVMPTSNYCTQGVASPVLGKGPWTWRCIGSTNGSTAACSTILPSIAVDGSCGSANASTFTAAPSAGLCSTGSASAVTGTGPWSWSCFGTNNGKNASCSANIAPTALNGSCGSANGMTLSSAPSASLCQIGNASAVSGSGPWTWSCSGGNGGSNASCSALKAAVPVNGSCGSAQGASFVSAPASGLCAQGTPTAVSGAGAWNWSCTGSDGGSTATCNAKFAYLLTTTTSGAGTISSSPSGIACGTSCSATFIADSSIILTATPTAGNVFTTWGGACSGTTPTCAVTMSAARSVSASFAPSPASPISLSLTPSQISGVAPLGVFFDASASTSTRTTLPFHEIKYSWNFGDPANDATWAFGAQPGLLSKNVASGPITGHLFETPGTYTVTLTAFDGVNTKTSNTTITVTDPNSFYSGANTICVASGSMPVAGTNGCPAGAAVRNLTTLSQVTALATGNKRILLKRGDTWSVTEAGYIAGSNTQLGAYGSGAAPKIQFTSDNYGFVTNNGLSNLTFMDLDFDGGAPSVTINKRALTLTGNNVVVLRATGTGVSDAIMIGGDNLFIVDSNFSHFVGGYGNVGIWSADSSRLAILGTRIYDATQVEHNIRTQGARPAVYSYNTIAGPAPTKQGMAIRGLVGAWTEHVLVSDNDISGGPDGAGDLVQFAPENTASNEPLRDIIFERNYVWGNVGNGIISEVSSNATYRNNIFNFNGAGGSASGISIVFQNAAGVAAPTSHYIYNNSFYYGGTAGFHALGVYSLIGTYPGGTVAKNNLAYAPTASNDGFNNGTQGVFYAGNVPAANNVLMNNSSNAQVKNTPPGFSTMPPVALTDWKPVGGSYPIGAGVAIPVWDDFFLKARSVPFDMGAAAP